MSGELREQTLSKAEIIARFIALEQDPRFRDFSGKIEVNEYGDLLMNAASPYCPNIQMGRTREEKFKS